MEEIYDYTDGKIIRTMINKWRMYYQISTIAEMTNNTGDYIRRAFMDKNEAQMYTSRSKLLWPIQKMPNIQTFFIWLQYIKTLLKSIPKDK
jgi:hypothetical protein